MSKLVLYITLLLILCTTLVSALVVSPNNLNLNVVKSHSYGLNFSFFNDWVQPIYNVSFVSVSNNIPVFSFPVIDVLNANTSMNYSGSFTSGDVFQDRFSLWKIVFSYQYGLNASHNNYSINLSNNIILPLDLYSGDSVTFFNDGSSAVMLRPFSNSSFPMTPILANSNVSILFYDPGLTYIFYVDNGSCIESTCVTGSFSVSLLPNSSIVHSEVYDIPVSFVVSSSLDSSILQYSILTNDLNLSFNTSYTGMIQLRNTGGDLLTHVKLSDQQGWVSFDENDFSMNGLSTKFIPFSITPIISLNNQSNIFWNDPFFVVTGGLNVSDTLRVFIPFHDFNLISSGGTNYTISLLNWNDTLKACDQHMYDPGFEICLEFAQRWGRNVTVVQQLAPVYNFSEQEVANLKNDVQSQKDERARFNNQLQTVFYREDELQNATLRNALSIDELNSQNVNWRTQFDVNMRKLQSQIFWGIICIVVFILLVFVLRVFRLSMEYDLNALRRQL